jgi:ABC-type cobalamin/Fe3+-siderophores transport system ATPase subunit
MQFQIPALNGAAVNIVVNAGEVLFVAGKNGSGKSTLILKWAASRPNQTMLSGNREVSFTSSAVSLTPQQMREFREMTSNFLTVPQSRTKRGYHNNQSWLDTFLSRLSALITHNMALEVSAHRKGDAAAANELRDQDPIIQINDVLSEIGINLSIEINRDSKYIANRLGLDITYGIDEMSDGERAALILIGSAILADSGEVFTIDEPEKHMHRSISSPLLRELFRRRPDLIWVVATHDVALLRDFADAKLLVLYDFNGTSWNFDLLDSTHEIPDDIIDAIYGAREKVLFIEGQQGRSLDEPLYRVLFPNTTFKSQGSCNEVKRAVQALNEVGALNSMVAKGIVDRDNEDAVPSLIEAGVAKLMVYAVESLYFHPAVVQSIAELLGKGADVERVLREACQKVDDETISRNAQSIGERIVRMKVQSNIPKASELMSGKGSIEIDLKEFGEKVTASQSAMMYAKANKNWSELITIVKIKSTQAPSFIIQSLGLTKDAYYQQARRAISNNAELRLIIMQLVPDPFNLPPPTPPPAP